MTTKKATSYEEFEAELLQDPEIRKEYDALKPKYHMIQSLISRRNHLRISQAKLASIIGTQQPAISRLEKGGNNTTIGTLFRVTEALGLDVEFKPKSLTKS
jgi:DNA-binding XRE family transcriptional regulator